MEQEKAIKMTDKDIMASKRVAYCAGMSPEDYKTAKSFFPESTLIDFHNYKATYNAVVEGDCDVAIVPIEKSFAGEVSQVIELLFSGELFINKTVTVDSGKDTIRYAVLSRVETKPAEAANTRFMMMFTVRDETGCLAKAINTISSYGYNMSIMRSRHMKDLPWHYYFYAEAVGDDTTSNGVQMLAAMKDACQSLKVLGRYNAD